MNLYHDMIRYKVAVLGIFFRVVKKKTWIYQFKKKKKKSRHKYMKFYNILLLMIWKCKKWLMRVKVRTDDADMRVIKW